MANFLQRSFIISLVSVLGLGTTLCAATLPPDAPADLSVTAWMDLGDGNANGIIVEVNVNGTKDWGRPDADGRVELLLPADAVALIHFRKPGHLTKTVSVDTHNMQNGGKHELSFGVTLEPKNGNEDLAYAGPVGTIAFDAASGELVIEHDQHLMPVRQQKVVF